MVARINELKPVWHINDMEARTHTGLEDLGQAGERILEECDNAVVITTGAEGALLQDATVEQLMAEQESML